MNDSSFIRVHIVNQKLIQFIILIFGLFPVFLIRSAIVLKTVFKAIVGFHKMFSACSKSAIRSSSVSIPIDRRIMLSEMPNLTRFSAGTLA